MKFYLAPLEGITTHTFRRVFNRHFSPADKYFTPFIGQKNVSSKERNEILPKNNEGMVTVPQILTNSSEDFLLLSEVFRDYGYESVNLNLGCPSKTVTTRGRGAGFLGKPDDLELFLDEIFDKSKVNISIKTRIGMEDVGEWERILKIYSKYPLEELIIHPRLQKEMYTGKVHKECFEAAYELIKVPLCFNGDITDRESFNAVVNEFPKIDSVMIGRGILRNPALFGELRGEESKMEFSKALREFHDDLLNEYKMVMEGGDTNILYKMKDVWTFLSPALKDCDKQLKQIRKAGRMIDYKIAVDEIFTRINQL